MRYQENKLWNQGKLRVHFIVCLGLFALAGCKPDLKGELGEPFNNLTGMYGTWELASFSQTDLKSPLKEVRELSELYIDGIVTPMRLTLNEDSSYDVTLEKGLNYFGEQGTWGLDNDLHPSYLILHTLDEEGMPIDTLTYSLGAVVRPHDNLLDVVYERFCENPDDPYLAYTFSFNRLP